MNSPPLTNHKVLMRIKATFKSLLRANCKHFYRLLHSPIFHSGHSTNSNVYSYHNISFLFTLYAHKYTSLF